MTALATTLSRKERDELCMSLWADFQAEHAVWRESGDPEALQRAKRHLEIHNRVFCGGTP